MTDDDTVPGFEGVVMITVAETLAPAATSPKSHCALAAELVQVPAEITLTTLIPDGAGAVRLTLSMSLLPVFLSLATYATVPEAVTGLGVPVRVTVTEVGWADADDAPTRTARSTRSSGRRRTPRSLAETVKSCQTTAPLRGW